MPISLRAAQPADVEALATLHVAVWRHVYRDLAPPAAQAALTVETRIVRWKRMLAEQPDRRCTLIADIDGAMAGFAHGGAPGDPVFGSRGEIKLLYVKRACARQGVGRLLLVRMAAVLSTLGYRGIGLGVVVGNDAAVAFYEALGGRILTRYTDPGPLWRSENLLIVWDDLSGLLAREA